MGDVNETIVIFYSKIQLIVWRYKTRACKWKESNRFNDREKDA